jgi:hypothetical protein
MFYNAGSFVMSKTTLSTMAVRIKTNSIIAIRKISIMALSIRTISIMTISVMTFKHNDATHNLTQHINI